MAIYGKQRVGTGRGEVFFEAPFFEARQMVIEGRLFEEDRKRTERERRIFRKAIGLVAE
jgi:hypothetical protein